MWVVSSIRPCSSIGCLLLAFAERHTRPVRIQTLWASLSLPDPSHRKADRMFDFTGRVVIVTGAGGSLGSAVARRFLEAGARLCLAELSADLLKRRYPELPQDGDHYLAAPVDANDPDSVRGMVDQVVCRLGRLDMLVNTVGGFRSGVPVHETPIEAWDGMMNLNARTAFIVSRAVVPHMLRRGSGKIISVAARPGLQGRAQSAAYSASKAAVIRLTESLSTELGDSGINVNCVIPGTQIGRASCRERV